MYVGFIVSGEVERVRGKLSRPILHIITTSTYKKARRGFQLRAF